MPRRSRHRVCLVKMKLIAHRGLFNGPNPNIENKPEQIELAWSEGYDSEIDLWVVNAEFWLGHDEPTYPINKEWLARPGLWIHAKNLGALRWLTDTAHNFFWHQNDDYVITSHRWIWTFPEKELTQRSIRLMPEWHDPEFQTIKDTKCYGICSDYVALIRDIIANDQT
jgi:hypothetical protein